MKFNRKTKIVIVEVICLLCILLFAYAAVSKLLDFNTFQNQLGQSPILSAYAHWVVYLVPAVEILVAIALTIPQFRTVGLYAFFGIMMMFTTYIVIVLNFADFVPCSCGGVLEKMDWTQHLIFNVFFKVLVVFAILLSGSWNAKKKILLLLVLTITGICIVALLFAFSEKKMHRNNAFIRRYIPHPVEKVGEYNLEYNSYYIAGIDEGTTYLGNYTTPLSMTTLDISLGQFEEFRIEIDSMHLPYQRVRVSVEPPYFYFGDGTIPVLLRGSIAEWNASIYSYNEAYFTQYKVADTQHIGIVTMSSSTQSKALGSLKKARDGNTVQLNTAIPTQMKSPFAADGMLLWNAKHRRFLYLYFYRNKYEVVNKMMVYQLTGKTIDTVSQPILDVVYYKEKNQYKISGNSVVVNRLSATYGNYLYINSDRLGKYENAEILQSASIIDVYDITNNSYAFSFYLYHQRDQKLNEFRIYKDLLVALVGNKLWLYQLKPEYFYPNSNSTHTAQYQEKGRTPVEKSRPLTQ